MTAVMSPVKVGLWNNQLSKSHFPIFSESEAYIFNCLTLHLEEKVHDTQ